MAANFDQNPRYTPVMPHLFVNGLTVIDCSYLDTKRGLLGESWIVDVELFGDLDEQGMVFDFGHVKKLIKNTIDDVVDHKLLVPQHWAGLELNEDNKSNNETSLWFNYGDLDNKEHQRAIYHRSPNDALCLLPTSQITAEIVQEYLIGVITAVVPDNVQQIDINLRLEDIQGAQYQYSHGLKKHDGNCQRIAHGHRSRLEISVAGERQPMWERQWAKQWQDIYIATREDLIQQEHIRALPYLRFGYKAPQGEFEILLPQSCCYVIDTDTTVELIAWHIQQSLSQRHPEHHVSVRAFEGVEKGAIA